VPTGEQGRILVRCPSGVRPDRAGDQRSFADLLSQGASANGGRDEFDESADRRSSPPIHQASNLRLGSTFCAQRSVSSQKKCSAAACRTQRHLDRACQKINLSRGVMSQPPHMGYFSTAWMPLRVTCTAGRMLHDRHSDLKVPTHKCHVVRWFDASVRQPVTIDDHCNGVSPPHVCLRVSALDAAVRSSVVFAVPTGILAGVADHLGACGRLIR
jgi:hypothetical protein